MKLSISGKTRGLLSKLQSVPTRNQANWYPRVAGDDYEELWTAFLKSVAARDCVRTYGMNTLGQFYTVALFLSYLSKYTRVPELGAEALYDPRRGRDAVLSCLSKTRIVDKLGLKYFSHSYSLGANEIKWLRCLLDIDCSGVIVYKLSGRKPLDAYLGSLSPSVFKSIPVELRSDKPFGKAPVRKQKLLVQEKQLDSTYGWVSIPCAEATVEIARARYNTVLIRYSFPVEGLYPYGSEDVSSFTRKLRKAHDSLAGSIK